jgi:IS5 family transposase
VNILSKQRTLAMMTGFERYTKKTRRAIFLEEMEQVVPWAKLCALIEPHYPKPGNGRRPKELEQMLRIYFLQQWFNLADPAVEEALYDSATLRQFVGIDLGAEPVPDETTVCKFRHLLEEHNLGEEILGTVNLHLQAKGVRITTGTIVDATLIHAPSSTKNREQSRDPEMHQAKKGKNWYFGMARGRGQQEQNHSHGGGDGSQRFRCGDVAGPAAWRRNAGVGRRSVSGANRGDPRVRATSAGFHPAALSLQGPDRG